MDFATVLGIIAGISVTVERISEVIKPLYLKIKNYLFKKQYTECSKTEKEIISIILGSAICIASHVSINVPGLDNLLLQQILAGLVASLGSNFLHLALSIVVAIKDNTEKSSAN